MRPFPALLLLLAAGVSHAATPQQIGQTYAAEAATSQPAFTPSAKRGEALFRQRFAISEKMPTCASCHTDNPLANGQHLVTGKAVRPLAVAANGERFADPAKVHGEFHYSHPVFTRHATAIQRHIQASNGRNGVWLAGAWLGYGFHEDGLASALRVARQLNAVAPWKALADAA